MTMTTTMKTKKPVQELTIEAGIPIPVPRSPRLNVKAVLERMKVGDSFLANVRNRPSIWIVAKRLGFRMQSAATDQNGSLRIWRIK